MNLYTFIWIIGLVFASPIRKRDGEQKCIFAPGETLVEDSESTKNENRLDMSKVSNECSEGDLKPLADYINHGKALFGAENTAHLIIARGFGIFSSVKANPIATTGHICEKHFLELSKDWAMASYKHFKTKEGSNKIPKCSFPESLTDSNFHNRGKLIGTDLPRLTYAQAAFILRTKNVLLHPGLPICNKHAKKINEEVENAIDENLHETYDPENDDPNQCSANEQETDEECDEEEQTKDCTIKNKIQELASVLGLNRITTRESFLRLSIDTQNKKVRQVRKMFSAIIRYVAPDCSIQFQNLVHEGEKFAVETKAQIFEDNLLKTIAFEHDQAINPTSRTAILSLVSPFTPFKTLKKYIPTISISTYKRSKYFVSLEELKRKEETVAHRERFLPEAIYNFIIFLASTSTDLPTCSSKIKLSNGDEIDICESVRLQNQADTIRLYNDHLIEQGKNEEYLMSTSTYVRIMNNLPIKQTKVHVCVDYYLGDGEFGFDELTEIVSRLEEFGYLDPTATKEIVKLLKEVRHFLINVYPYNLEWSSKFVELSIVYGLNENSGSDFHENIETPSYRCDDCFQLDLVIDQISRLLADALPNVNMNLIKSVQLLNYRFNAASKNIHELKKHLLRIGHDNFALAKIVDEMMSSPNEEVAVVTLDWAQKFLPQGYRETQREYFGKRGLPWHITHIQIQREGLHYYHYIAHLFESSKQDSQAVIAILFDVCKFLKERTYVKKVILRSDNAACYKSQEVLFAIPSISAKTNIEIVRYTFSESQNGKGPSDRGAAMGKRKAKNFLNAQNDIKTASDLFTALTGKNAEDNEPICKKDRKSFDDGNLSTTKAPIIKPPIVEVINTETNIDDKNTIDVEMPIINPPIMESSTAETPQKSEERKRKLTPSYCVQPITGMSVFYSKLKRTDYKAASKFEKISELSDFVFQNNKVAIRRFAFIGRGKHYDQVIVDNLPSIENQAYYIPTEIFNLKTRRSTTKVTEDSKTDDVPIDETDSTNNFEVSGHHSVFECRICHQRFLTMKGYQNHIDKNIHKTKQVVEPMTDIAIKFFASNAQGHNPISKKIAQEIAQQSGTSENLPNVPSIAEEEGWALPSRKRNTRFSDKQKTFLQEIFDAGEESGEKNSPEIIQKQMMLKVNSNNSPYFETNELLNRQQIQSYLTRLSAAKKKEKHNEEKTIKKREIDEEEDEENEDDEVEFDEVFQMAENSYDWIVQNLDELIEKNYNDV